MICCCADGHLTLYFCIADGLVENPLVCSGDFFCGAGHADADFMDF